MDKDVITREEWEALRSEVADLKMIVTPLYEAFKEATFLFRFLKWVVYAATAGLTLWALIKSNFFK